MRGRLFYYCYWHQEARSYLVYLARRQYATGPGLPGGKSSGVRSHFPKSGSHLDAEEMSHNSAWPLTEELHFALIFFLSLIRSETFKKGIEPQRYLNRLKAIVYTDGSRSDAERGIGGVFFGSHLQTCFFAEDLQDDEFYPHIAVVEMRAILRALRLFGEQLFPVCAPGFQDGRLPERPADLATLPLLRHPRQPWSPWFQAVGLRLPEPARGPLFSEMALLLEAAAAGQGIALARAALVEGDLASGRLVRLFDIDCPDQFAYHLVWRMAEDEDPRLAAFTAWLDEVTAGPPQDDRLHSDRSQGR